METNYPIIPFVDAAVFRAWLDTHNNDTDGIWLMLYKKASGIQSITYAEALDEALCFGWIDGKIKSYDDVSYLQKFTPRRAKSLWSKRNIEHIERLAAEGRMKPAGLAEVQRAKDDGRWDAAYDMPSQMSPPDDLLIALQRNPVAATFYETLNKTNTYAIAWSLQTAKTVETRQRRLNKFIAMLERGEKLY